MCASCFAKIRLVNPICKVIIIKWNNKKFRIAGVTIKTSLYMAVGHILYTYLWQGFNFVLYSFVCLQLSFRICCRSLFWCFSIRKLIISFDLRIKTYVLPNKTFDWRIKTYDLLFRAEETENSSATFGECYLMVGNILGGVYRFFALLRMTRRGCSENEHDSGSSPRKTRIVTPIHW